MMENKLKKFKPNSSSNLNLLYLIIQAPDFPENILRNPDRFSKAIGLCDVGNQITLILTLLLKGILSDPKILDSVLRLTQATIDLYKINRPVFNK